MDRIIISNMFDSIVYRYSIRNVSYTYYKTSNILCEAAFSKTILKMKFDSIKFIECSGGEKTV